MMLFFVIPFAMIVIFLLLCHFEIGAPNNSETIEDIRDDFYDEAPGRF